MAEKKLTDVKVKTAKVVTGERLLSDGNGLFLRVRPGGKKDWLFIYSLDGRRRKQGLGYYPETSLERARERADESREAVAEGRDAISDRAAKEKARKAQEAAQAARPTILGLFETWHKRVAAQRKDEGAEIRRAFEKDVLPTIGAIFADQVTRRDVMAVLDKVKERGVTRYANQVLQYMRQMFRHGVAREIVAADPTFGLAKKDVGGKEGERERVLTKDEIVDLAKRLPKSGLAPEMQLAFWLILGTCCRVGELTKARWADVDLDHGTWTIPAENSKNGRPHLIHLSKFALGHMAALKAEATSAVWLYPQRSDKKHIDTKAIQRQFRDRQRDKRIKGRSKQLGALKATSGEWTAHDLRRTGATLMGDLGIRPDVIDRALNHVEVRKVTRTYQRQELLAERQAAFAALGQILERLASGEASKVVPIRAGAA